MKKTFKKAELQLLQKIANDERFHHRGFIKRFIKVNEYQPKYKVGDCVKIDDPYSYIYGVRCIGIKAKIVEIDWCCGTANKINEMCVQYECVAIVNGKEFTMFAEEMLDGSYTRRHITGKAKTNEQTLVKKSDTPSSTELHW